MIKRSGKEVSLWSLAIAAIVILSLVPVLWIISLSFKDPSTIADGSFLPSKWSWTNYSGIFKQSLYPEPAASTQSVYHALDPVVQAVFADRNASITDLLAQANDVAQKAIREGK